MKKSEKTNIEKELDLIYSKQRKILRPCDVVNFARNKKTALHGCFDWNDATASAKYRLQQARELITVHVVMIETNKKPIETQVFVSLPEDRVKNGGGYRKTIEVLSNKNLREQLLRQAFADAKAFQERYKGLKELAEIFKVMKKILKRKTG